MLECPVCCCTSRGEDCGADSELETYPCQHGSEADGEPICMLRPCSGCVVRCFSCDATFCPDHAWRMKDGHNYCAQCRALFVTLVTPESEKWDRLCQSYLDLSPLTPGASPDPRGEALCGPGNPHQPGARQDPGMKRIFWESRATGQGGHGEPILPETADRWVERLNEEYPTLRHWAEDVFPEEIKQPINKETV